MKPYDNEAQTKTIVSLEDELKRIREEYARAYNEGYNAGWNALGDAMVWNAEEKGRVRRQAYLAGYANGYDYGYTDCKESGISLYRNKGEQSYAEWLIEKGAKDD